MAKYAGLTNDTKRRKGEHADPPDWKVVKKFDTELEARDWEDFMHKTGYKGAGGGAGWRYGYTYTITAQTIESTD